MSIRRIVLACALGAAIGCGGSSTAPSTSGGTSNPPAGSNNRGSITATIDGAAWSGTLSTVGVAAGNLALAAEDSTGLALGFGAPARVGTTSIALASPTNASLQRGGVGWWASGNKGSGSVTITSVTATSASGTFSFTMVPLTSSATGNRQVTNGRFDVTF